MAMKQVELNQQLLQLRKDMQKLEDRTTHLDALRDELEKKRVQIRETVEGLTAEDADRQNEIDAEIEKVEADRNMIEADRAANDQQKVELQDRISGLEAELDELNQRADTAAHTPEKERKNDIMETRADILMNTKTAQYQADEVRSQLISGGTLATPTGVSGINEQVGVHYSSILDFVNVVNCVGMGSNKVAYMIDAAAAATQTEGSAATVRDATFGFVTIQPTNLAVVSQISKQAKKQSPLQYEAKVSAAAMRSLKKAAVAHIATKLAASALNTSLTLQSIDQKALRTIALTYGGTEAVEGEAVLLLNKHNLIAFGDVRGTNEKKAVYEITPDAQNPNTGIIKDGGLAVRYCLMNDLANTEIYYGNPKCFELDLFSDYEVRVSEDFAITSLMDTIVGDCEVGGDVVVSGGFVAVTI